MCGSARADPSSPIDDDIASARQAFLDGVTAEDAGRFGEALELYARARRFAASPALLFNMAFCEEHLGRLLEAAADYEEARAFARARGDADVERESTARSAAVRGMIPHLIVRLPSGAGAVTATLDGRPIDPATLDRIATDPGTHHLVVRSARTERPFDAAIELAEGAEQRVDVEFGSTASPPPPAPEPARTAAPRPTNVPALAMGATAIAFCGGALATGIAGHHDLELYLALNARPTLQNVPERERLRSGGQALFTANAVLTAATVISLGMATYFLLRPEKRPPAANRGAGAPATGPIGSADSPLSVSW
jgi:hypothetical protein